MNVNLPEDSFWPTKTKIKARNPSTAYKVTTLQKNQEGLGLKGQDQERSEGKALEATVEAITPLEPSQGSFGSKVRQLFCLDS